MRNFFIIGFKAAGKSDFGMKLSNKLEWLYVDIDQLLLMRSGYKTAYDMYIDIGKDNFLKKEAEVVQDLLSKQLCETVFSLGGMTPLNPYVNLFELKEHGVVVLLDTPLEKIKERIKKLRTIYQDLDVDALYHERVPRLRLMADIVVSSYEMEEPEEFL